MLLQVILEGLGLGALLVLVCAAGIRKGAVGMVHLYPMGQPPAGVQPGLYAGVQRPDVYKRQGVARTGQPCTHDDGHEDARQTQIDDDGVVLYI